VKAGDGAVGVGCEKDKMVLGAVRGEGELWFPKDERPKGEKG
jgi:hypothetical protein